MTTLKKTTYFEISSLNVELLFEKDTLFKSSIYFNHSKMLIAGLLLLKVALLTGLFFWLVD